MVRDRSESALSGGASQSGAPTLAGGQSGAGGDGQLDDDAPVAVRSPRSVSVSAAALSPAMPSQRKRPDVSVAPQPAELTPGILDKVMRQMSEGASDSPRAAEGLRHLGSIIRSQLASIQRQRDDEADVRVAPRALSPSAQAGSQSPKRYPSSLKQVVLHQLLTSLEQVSTPKAAEFKVASPPPKLTPRRVPSSGSGESLPAHGLGGGSNEDIGGPSDDGPRRGSPPPGLVVSAPSPRSHAPEGGDGGGGDGGAERVDAKEGPSPLPSPLDQKVSFFPPSAESPANRNRSGALDSAQDGGAGAERTERSEFKRPFSSKFGRTLSMVDIDGSREQGAGVAPAAQDSADAAAAGGGGGGGGGAGDGLAHDVSSGLRDGGSSSPPIDAEGQGESLAPSVPRPLVPGDSTLSLVSGSGAESGDASAYRPVRGASDQSHEDWAHGDDSPGVTVSEYRAREKGADPWEEEAGQKVSGPGCAVCREPERFVASVVAPEEHGGGSPVPTRVVEPSSKLQSLDCGHQCCSGCLESHIESLIQNKTVSTILCPVPACGRIVEAGTLQRVVSSTVFNAYLEATLAVFLSQDVMSFPCPNPQCGGLLSASPFQPPAKLPNPIPERDDKGRVLSADAYLHFQEFRLRCRHCDVVFCAACKRMPYHKGFTCQQYQQYLIARECRFCAKPLDASNEVKAASVPPAFKDLCTRPECLEKVKMCCDKILPCGCPCNGVRGEAECLPCLKCDLGVAQDFCPICWVEELRHDVCIQMRGPCRHTFHLRCATQQVESKWPNARISFAFLMCPLCKKELTHPALESVLAPARELYEHVKQKALIRLQYERLENHSDIVSAGGRFFRDPAGFAMDHFSFYMCHKCKKPYFGGARACDADVNAGQFEPEDLVCPACQPSSIEECPKHGKDWIVHKCRFCCSVATFHCWGNTHFCSRCHNPTVWKTLAEYRTGRNVREVEFYPQCPGIQTRIADVMADRSLGAKQRADAINSIMNPLPKLCPLGIVHPPNGIEFSLGCALCREQEMMPISADESKARVEPPLALDRPKKKDAQVGVLRWGFPGECCAPPEEPDGAAPPVRAPLPPPVPAPWNARIAPQPPALPMPGPLRPVPPAPVPAPTPQQPAPAEAPMRQGNRIIPIGVLRWGFISEVDPSDPTPSAAPAPSTPLQQPRPVLPLSVDRTPAHPVPASGVLGSPPGAAPAPQLHLQLPSPSQQIPLGMPPAIPQMSIPPVPSPNKQHLPSAFFPAAASASAADLLAESKNPVVPAPELDLKGNTAPASLFAQAQENSAADIAARFRMHASLPARILQRSSLPNLTLPPDVLAAIAKARADRPHDDSPLAAGQSPPQSPPPPVPAGLPAAVVGRAPASQPSPAPLPSPVPGPRPVSGNLAAPSAAPAVENRDGGDPDMSFSGPSGPALPADCGFGDGEISMGPSPAPASAARPGARPLSIRDELDRKLAEVERARRTRQQQAHVGVLRWGFFTLEAPSQPAPSDPEPAARALVSPPPAS